MKNIVVKQCEVCGDDFEIYPPSRAKQVRCCSQVCAGKIRGRTRQHLRKEIECLNCHSKFKAFPCRTPKFCNQKCFGEYFRKQIQVACEYCGEVFHKRPAYFKETKHHYCSRACFALARLTKVITPRQDRNLRAKLLQRGLINICERCGFNISSILQIHHRDKNHSNNKMDNLEILCPNCHALEHRVFNK